MNISTKNALITGGSKRIGAEIAKFLATSGWNVMVHYCNSENEISNLLSVLRKFKVKCDALKCDFNNPYEIEIFFQKAISEFGAFSLLINNASSFINDSFDKFSIESLIYNNNVNYIANAILINKFFNQQNFNINNRGNIINILDYCIYSYPDNFYSYTLSKMAQKNLIDINAKLLAPYVRINGIAPGAVMKADKQKEENFIRSYKESPLKISTKISEILNAIEFIINSDSLTGSIIPLDSGKRYTCGLFM